LVKMDLRLSAEEERFRQEVVTFIDDAFPHPARIKPTPAEIEHWHLAVADKGWAAPEWPVTVGGTGWTQSEIFLWYVATAERNCPQPDYYGLQVVAPLLLEFGDIDQQRHLAHILDRSETWGDAVFFDGSSNLFVDDLGDQYQIRGHGICIANAKPDRLLVLADTGNGHSLFVVDPHLEGIGLETVASAKTVRSLKFDETSMVKNCLLGDANMASKYMEFLLVEKQSLSQVVHLESGFRYLNEVIQRFGLQSEMAERVAGIEIELSALKITGLRYKLPVHHQHSSGNVEAQIIIVKGLELAQRIGESLIDALGYYAIPAEQVLPGSNEPPPVFTGSRWKSSLMEIMPGCPDGFRQDLIAKTLLGL